MSPWLCESLKYNKTGFKRFNNRALIFEKACVECGGEAGLRAACSRGDVHQKKKGSVTFYIFPEFEVGGEDAFGLPTQAQPIPSIWDTLQ